MSVTGVPVITALSMMAMSVCSFMVNGPGFNENEYPKTENRYLGRVHSKSLPKGRVMVWMRRALIITEGTGILINTGSQSGHRKHERRNAITVLKLGMIRQKRIPRNHLQRVHEQIGCS